MAQNRPRRTSNFLELPVSDYELRLRQKRHCSLPERSYNPRQAPNEFYKFRSFSIKPNGCLINHGDVIAKRRASKSSSCSTANTSRNNSPGSPRKFGSPHGSRDASPRCKSPVESFTFTTAPGSSSGSKTTKSSGGDTNSCSVDEIAEDQACLDETEEVQKHRVCILGTNDVGKTSLVNQFLTSEYMNTYDASLDDEYGERCVSVNLDGEESELVFIDHPAGEMSVENMLSTYEPHACVVVYSVVDRGTFQNAEDILGYLWRFGFAKKMTLLLVANKVDMERSRLVTCEEGRKLARSCEAKFIETSAGIQHNVDELLVGVLKQIRLRIEIQTMSSSNKKKSEDDSESCIIEKSNRLTSPLRTLQVARDIISRTCFSHKKGRPMECENLHIL